MTADVDIRKMHKELKRIDKKLAFFKTIILIDKPEIAKFLDIIHSDPEVNTPSNDKMNLNETFIAEISEFLKIEVSEIKETLKGLEDRGISHKIEAVISKLKKVDKKEDKKENKKEMKKESEDWYHLEDIEFEKDNNYIQAYGLHTNENFGEIVNQLGAYESGNYNLDAGEEKKNNVDIYEKVYKYQASDVEAEYLPTLKSFYKQLCMKCISSFFKELNIKEIMTLVKETSGNLDKFISYLLIKGNDAAMAYYNTRETKLLDEFESLMEKLVKTCIDNEEFTDLIDILYKKSIIKHNIDLLTAAIENKNENLCLLYGSESVTSKTLNILIIPNILKILRKINPAYLYSNTAQLHDLISMLFLIPLAFRNEYKLQRDIYITIYKLLLPIAKNPENYSNEIKGNLLKIRVFQRMVDKCKFDITVSSGNRLTQEQKLLFEIFSLFHKIDSVMSESWSLYTYTDTLLELEKSKEILREGMQFDMISYLMYFNNELSGQQQHTKVYADTFHNMFKGKISSKIYFEGFKKMTFRFDEISSIEKDTFVGISSDPAGENILKKFSQEDLQKGNSVPIYSNQCYIHYPYKPPKIVGMGENNNFKLGQDN